MKTHDCEAGSHRGMALTAGARASLHTKCPGGYRTPDGEIHRCDCPCHEQHDTIPIEYLENARLPIQDPARPTTPTQADKTTKRPKKGAKGRCEHCGAPCNSRFVPGHDAKLKSELTNAADQGDPQAAAELWARGWMRLVAHNRIDTVTRMQGREISHRDSELVERRNSERASRYDGGMV